MDSFVADTQALVKFMTGKKVINDRGHQTYLSADNGESIIIIPAIVLMEMLYLFEKTESMWGCFKAKNFLKAGIISLSRLVLTFSKPPPELTTSPSCMTV
jgi:predicted nucleic acid-binding protein